MAHELKGEVQGQGLRIGIAASRFNEFITSRLVQGAREALASHGVREEDIAIVWVPGSFELPATAQRMARSGRWDALVCLGAVIRGETAHFEHVANQAAAGIAAVARQCDIPVIFGVLTTDTVEQAVERTGAKRGNRGCDAALSAIEMVNLNRRLDQTAPADP